MSDTPSTLAERLDILCAQLGLSRRGLARRSGLVETHLTMIMKKSLAREDTILKIARGTGCSVTWLQDGAGDPFDEGEGGFVSGVASVVAFARTVGISPELADTVARIASPGVDPDDLFNRMRVASASAKLAAERPAAGIYEAAALFARANGVQVEAIVQVRTAAIGGEWTTADDCYQAMLEADRLLIPGAAARERSAKRDTAHARRVVKEDPRRVSLANLQALGYPAPKN